MSFDYEAIGQRIEAVMKTAVIPGLSIAIIDQGQVVALDTPQALIQNLQAGMRVRFTNHNGYDPQLLRRVNGVTDVEQRGKQVIVEGNGALLAHVATALAEQNITPSDLRVEQADLEDVFLALTGRKIRS